MKAKSSKSRRSTLRRIAPSKRAKTFSTVQGTINHFFPEKKVDSAYVRGKERATREADRVFTEACEAVRT